MSPRIYLYPNPAEDYVELSGVYGALKSVEIFNQAGQSLKVFDAAQEDRMYVGDLASGLYILVSEDASGQRHSCILKKQ